MSKASNIYKMHYKLDFFEIDCFGKKKIYKSAWAIYESKKRCFGVPNKTSIETGKALPGFTEKNISSFL